MTAVEDKEQPQCPPGLGIRDHGGFEARYLLVAGGGMYIEVFNRGVIPLAYSIYKKNKAGETNTYLDGIYLLFTYFTKPESIAILEATLKTDDDVIRSTSFKISDDASEISKNLTIGSLWVIWSCNRVQLFHQNPTSYKHVLTILEFIVMQGHGDFHNFLTND
ncbi:hypothetical protein GH714_011193 [Hevea brasiliensis]|uniref:Uncharacterized protein n=1 Tax=Hevea brasiliensis TaxID=3981 RepID=A0A6A6MNC6_HEVBR|nr:hypothetical protein GH714_011193 [Hevea brasiliensis]